MGLQQGKEGRKPCPVLTNPSRTHQATQARHNRYSTPRNVIARFEQSSPDSANGAVSEVSSCFTVHPRNSLLKVSAISMSASSSVTSHLKLKERLCWKISSHRTTHCEVDIDFSVSPRTAGDPSSRMIPPAPNRLPPPNSSQLRSRDALREDARTDLLRPWKETFGLGENQPTRAAWLALLLSCEAKLHIAM